MKFRAGIKAGKYLRVGRSEDDGKIRPGEDVWLWGQKPGGANPLSQILCPASRCEEPLFPPPPAGEYLSPGDPGAWRNAT